MLQPRACKICGKHLGDSHQNASTELIASHIKRVHPTEAQRLHDIRNEVQKLQKEFREISGLNEGIGGSYFHRIIEVS